MSDIPDKVQHNLRLLKTLAYPSGKVGDGPLPSPPVVRKLEYSIPDDYPNGPDHVTFRLEFTNGVAITGAIGAILMTENR